MTGLLIETLIGFHVALAFVLLVRRPVARFCGAGWAYALWALPLARIVVPPQIFLPASTSSSLILLTPRIGEAAAPLPSPDGSGQWMPLLLALWAGGAALFILWQVSAYWRLSRAVARSERSRPRFGRWQVVETNALSAPVAMGFLDGKIVLPADFGSRFTSAEQAMALEHEATHLRRGDLWWNMAGLALLALSWFSPLAHWAFRAFRADQELSCDALVAARAGTAGRYDYASALVKSASQPGLIAACPLNHAAQLKRRLKMMKTHRAGGLRRILGGASTAALLMLGLGISSANAQEKAENEPVTIKKVIIKRGGKDGKTFELSGNYDELIEKCRKTGGSETTTEGEGEKKVTRVVVCDAEGKMTPETRERAAAALESALAETDAFKGKHGEEVRAIVTKEVSRLREGK